MQGFECSSRFEKTNLALVKEILCICLPTELHGGFLVRHRGKVQNVEVLIWQGFQFDEGFRSTRINKFFGLIIN